MIGVAADHHLGAVGGQPHELLAAVAVAEEQEGRAGALGLEPRLQLAHRLQLEARATTSAHRTSAARRGKVGDRPSPSAPPGRSACHRDPPMGRAHTTPRGTGRAAPDADGRCHARPLHPPHRPRAARRPPAGADRRRAVGPVVRAAVDGDHVAWTELFRRFTRRIGGRRPRPSPQRPRDRRHRPGHLAARARAPPRAARPGERGGMAEHDGPARVPAPHRAQRARGARALLDRVRGRGPVRVRRARGRRALGGAARGRSTA